MRFDEMLARRKPSAPCSPGATSACRGGALRKVGVIGFDLNKAKLEKYISGLTHRRGGREAVRKDHHGVHRR
jgi:hypothetical protein